MEFQYVLRGVMSDRLKTEVNVYKAGGIAMLPALFGFVIGYPDVGLLASQALTIVVMVGFAEALYNE